MDQMVGQGQGGFGGQAGFPLETWFWEMPVCTRLWTTSTVIMAILVQCDVVYPLRLFYTFKSAFLKQQFWRLISTFIYFGPLSIDLIFQVFFIARYAKTLESQSPSPAHFAYLLLFICASLLALSPLFTLPFLAHPLSSTLVYIWSRRNPDVRLSLLGLLVFPAPYLPYILMGFSFVFHGSIPRDEIMGGLVGHVWYFFEDVYPPLHGGYRPFEPPRWWKAMFDGGQETEAMDEQGTVADGVIRPTDGAQVGAPQIVDARG